MQKQEVHKAIKLPLIQYYLYTQIGIDPPRGVLLYGPPGTGKTMMANTTQATFISMVGSEFVKKYLREGPRMVHDVFRLAQENLPCVVFIDEIDDIAFKRFDAQTRVDREVQRILLELLNQMDGSRLSWPLIGRIHWIQHCCVRDVSIRKSNFCYQIGGRIVWSSRRPRNEFDWEDYVNRSEKIIYADVSLIYAEACLQAVRGKRYAVLPKEFDAAYKKSVNCEQ